MLLPEEEGVGTRLRPMQENWKPQAGRPANGKQLPPMGQWGGATRRWRSGLTARKG